MARQTDGTAPRIALFSQDMAEGAFCSVFAGLAHALSSVGAGPIDLLTLKGDMTAPERPFPETARPVRIEGGGSAGAILPLARHLGAVQPAYLISGPILPNFGAILGGRIARRRFGWRGRIIISHHHPLRLARRQSAKNSPMFARLLYPRADASFAVSPAVRAEAIEVARLDPARVAVIPNVLAPLEPWTGPPPHPWLLRPRDGTLLVSVGRLVPEKNIPLLIEALDLAAREADLRLLIVGRGPEECRLRDLVQARGLGERIALSGGVAAIRPYLDGADAFVLASDEEGFGQVLSEAMSVGLPVAATDAAGGGVRFILDGGKAGLLTPRGDRASLVRSLLRLNDPECRADLSARSRARAEVFKPQGVGRCLVDWLESL